MIGYKISRLSTVDAKSSSMEVFTWSEAVQVFTWSEAVHLTLLKLLYIKNVKNIDGCHSYQLASRCHGNGEAFFIYN